MIRLFIILLALNFGGPAYGDAPPVINIQPLSQTNDAGATIMLSVTASGGGPISYSWRVNGANVMANTNMLGTSNATLVISNVQKFHSGTYTVLITNASGSITSQPAVLTVIGPIQKLVNQANAEQTIQIPFGRYFDNVVIEKHLVLIGETSASGQTAISGYNSGTVFTISSNATVVLSNLSIQQGGNSGIINAGSLKIVNCGIGGCFAVYGAGIWNSGRLVLNSTIITSNGDSHRTWAGGGIYNAYQGLLIMTNVDVTFNDAWNSGGGLYNEGTAALYSSCLRLNLVEFGGGGGGANNGTLSLFDVDVIENTSYVAAGIINGGELSALQSNFSDNAVQGSPSAFSNIGRASVTNCWFEGNEGMNGPVLNSGTMTMVAVTVGNNPILPNLSPAYCGLRNNGTLHLLNSYVVNNVSYDTTAYAIINGGGGNLFLEYCSILNNRGVEAGVLNTGHCALLGTLISGNVGYIDPRGNCGATPCRDCTGVFDSKGHNLIQRTNGCAFTNVSTGLLLGVDPNLAIDAGSPTDFPFSDIAGNARPVDGNGDGVARADIGAREIGSYRRPYFFAIGQVAPGQVRLRCQMGLPGQGYVVEASADLRAWTAIATNTADAAGQFQLDVDTTDPAFRFYRTFAH